MLDGQVESRIQPAAEVPGPTVPSSEHVKTTGAIQGLSSEDASKAASLIQRNYRGYRERRELDGVSVNAASRRWADAVKEAQWQNATKLRPRTSRNPTSEAQPAKSTEQAAARPPTPRFANSEWRRLAVIARRAGNDDTSEEEAEEGMNDAEFEAHRKLKVEAKKKREQSAQTMGLEYFLEMVDEKHRYGSHLRSYHAEWKKADTHENFFYWLDEGEGRNVEVERCSREVLDRDRVRYLTREERMKYLIKVDKQGRLIYAKNGQRVNTSPQYKDSLEGIVSMDSDAPVFREVAQGKTNTQQEPGRAGSTASVSSGSSHDSAKAPYANHDLHDAHGVKKIQKVSADALLNHLLQSTTKKNTWIFVADTSFRLYIGIKQSGAFQHSSFLRGARISAAGVIKIKDGQLRSLSPLSGHYRPPTRNFRAFVHSLKEEGVDMSRVNISKSFAVLLGVEGYKKTKKQAEAGMKDLELRAEKVLNPEAVKKREDLEKDKSESARKELEHVQRVKSAEEERKRSESLVGRMQRKFGLGRAAKEKSPR